MPLLDDASRRRTSWAPIAIAVGAMLVLAVHAWQYLPFIEDDAFISLRYARRLLDGHGLTWTDGRPVEGYSNLLWILLVSASGLFGADLVLTARVLGVLGMSAAVAAVVWEAYRRPGTHGVNAVAQKQVAGAAREQVAAAVCADDGGRAGWPSAVVAGLTLALANPIAVWTIGGLEQPMLAALLAWAIVLCGPLLERPRVSAARVLAPSLLFALTCLTRPDGVIFTAAVAAAIWFLQGWSRTARRTIALLVSLPALFYAGQLVFRLAYYGEWVPNTALVKITPSLHHLAGGGRYLLDGLLVLTPLSWLSLFFLLVGLFIRSERRWLLFLLVLGGAWAGYVVFIGGDGFVAWRHGIPLVLFMALVLARGTTWLRRYARDAGWKGTCILSVACLFVWFIHEQRLQAHRQRWRMDAGWEWDSQAIGLMLKRGFGDRQPLLAVSSAGSLPYWSELPAVDMLGLNDYYLPRHPPTDLGSGLLGHELGDGQYVLDRRPDLVLFHGGGGRAEGIFPGEKQMQAQPRFAESYTLAHFEAREPRRCEARVWVRRYSEKIGIRDTGGEIAIPAYLLNAFPETTAYLDPVGRFVVAVSPQRPAGIRNLLLAPGRWRVEADASSGLDIDMRAPAPPDSAFSAVSMDEYMVIGQDPIVVDLVLISAAQEDVVVREVKLIRLPTVP